MNSECATCIIALAFLHTRFALRLLFARFINEKENINSRKLLRFNSALSILKLTRKSDICGWSFIETGSEKHKLTNEKCSLARKGERRVGGWVDRLDAPGDVLGTCDGTREGSHDAISVLLYYHSVVRRLFLLVFRFPARSNEHFSSWHSLLGPNAANVSRRDRESWRRLRLRILSGELAERVSAVAGL